MLASLKAKVLSIQRIPTGLVYEFPNTAEISSEVHRVVQLEQECCGFLRFYVDESNQRIRLEVTGPEGAIGLIEDFFGDNVQ